KILIVLATITLIVWMFPKGESLEFDVQVNSIWIHDDLIATTSFEILKDPLEYQNEIELASSKVHPVFLKDDVVLSVVKDSITSYNVYLLDILDRDLFLDEQDGEEKTIFSEETYNTFKEIRRQENLLSTTSSVSFNDINRVVDNIVNGVYRKGLIDRLFDDIDKDSISVREGKFQRIIPKTNYYDPENVESLINRRLEYFFSQNQNLKSAILEYVLQFLYPNVMYNNNLTEEAQQIAIRKIPTNKGIINENERIVAKHDRITQEVKSKIDSYKIAKGVESSYLSKIAQDMGKFIHVIVILALLSIYIYLFRKRIYNNNFNILLISVIILLISASTFLISQLNVSGPIQYLILVPVASMLMTIIFDSRIGFYITVVLSLIIGALRGNDYAIVVTYIFAGGLGAYTVRDIKNRSQIFRSFLFILAGYILCILAFGLERFDSFQQLLINTIYATVNSILSPALTFGLIIFFEKIFGITTDLTLLELSDFNSTPLKDLAKNAPGTFNHSMIIGSMVESAAEAIGANPILARVGAYYHDIGKSVNPSGYVENQVSGDNLHEKLKPKESTYLILEHVKKGIELAKKYKLPNEIIEFIPMHHGTMVVSFFYEKAKEEYGEDNVDIDEYKYPGPKPNSKETALLMLGDACESAVRAMTDPDPTKIKNMINNLVKLRIDDGQLDESPLTLSDLNKIKETFLKILISQHHKRIKYPKQ
ncbi:HD family phosphohydrolase, partial [Bacteroidota bacterium]